MKAIKDYFKGFSAAKWVMFALLTLLVIFALEEQATRLYWKYWEFEPLKIHKITILNPDHKVAAGDLLYYEIEYTKYTPLLPVITTQIINGYSDVLAPSYPAEKPLGYGKHPGYIPIKRAADYGYHRFRRTWTYFYGPEKRPVSVTATSEPWQVVPPCKPDPLKGEKGLKGDTGMVGPQGEQGKQGVPGVSYKTMDDQIKKGEQWMKAWVER